MSAPPRPRSFSLPQRGIGALCLARHCVDLPSGEHAFERFAEEEGRRRGPLDGGERDGGREPTTTSGLVSTPRPRTPRCECGFRGCYPSPGKGFSLPPERPAPRWPASGGTGAAHPSRARRDDVRRRCASGHQHDHAQRLLVPGHYRRAGPAGAGRCWRPGSALGHTGWVLGSPALGRRSAPVAGPDQDLHDRQEHDHQQQRPQQP